SISQFLRAEGRLRRAPKVAGLGIEPDGGRELRERAGELSGDLMVTSFLEKIGGPLGIVTGWSGWRGWCARRAPRDGTGVARGETLHGNAVPRRDEALDVGLALRVVGEDLERLVRDLEDLREERAV